MPLQQLIDLWNQFFHSEVSCATVVVWRVLVGGLLLLNAFFLLPLIPDYFSEDGVWPTSAWLKHQKSSRFCLLTLMPPTTRSFRLLLLVHAVASLGFLIGFHFRFCAITVFLTLVSIHHRNAYILSSGDTLLRLLIFYSSFSNAGGGLSVDRWMAGHRLSEFDTMEVWPMRLMQLQICVVYLRTVYWKLRGRMWWKGTAAWYPLWVDAYVRFRPPVWMLRPALIRIATWGTLIEELALGSLIWIREFRYPMIITGIVLHLIFDLIMNLQFFSWIMMISLLLFCFPEDVEHWLRMACS
jgi:hypothetical protein